MLTVEYRYYLKRAERARTVKELRQIADDVKAAVPGDDEAELIDQTCFTFATALIERTAERRPYMLVNGALRDTPALRAV